MDCIEQSQLFVCIVLAISFGNIYIHARAPFGITIHNLMAAGCGTSIDARQCCLPLPFVSGLLSTVNAVQHLTCIVASSNTVALKHLQMPFHQ